MAQKKTKGKISGCPVLIIGGVTKPRNKKAVKKERTKKSVGVYLNGVKDDVRNMENYVNQSTAFKLHNTVRNMLHLKVADVKKEIQSLAFKTYVKEAIGGSASDIAIYYSGHGAGPDGSWCFKDGDLNYKWLEYPLTRGNIKIFCDSCFSGNWARNLQSLENKTKNVWIFAASYPNKSALDGENGGLATNEWLDLFPCLFDGRGIQNALSKFQQLYGCLGYIDNGGKYHYLEFKDSMRLTSGGDDFDRLLLSFQRLNTAADTDEKQKSIQSVAVAAGVCSNGHKLKKANVYQLIEEGYLDGFGCDACGAHKYSKYSYHCSKCEYDLCSGCFRLSIGGQKKVLLKSCAKGHKLRKMSLFQLIQYYKFESYLYGFVCDHCKAQSSQNKTLKYSYHCAICQYDLCSSCYS